MQWDADDWSIFPCTILYASNTKIPYDPEKHNVSFDFYVDDDDTMSDVEEILENVTTTLREGTTTKGAKPNYRLGKGDNLWALAMTILECIYGQHPLFESEKFSMDYLDSIDIKAVYKYLVETDFYQQFKESEVYLNFYQDDEDDFAPIDEFLLLSLEKDKDKREMNIMELFEEDFEVDASELKNELSEYFDLDKKNDGVDLLPLMVATKPVKPAVPKKPKVMQKNNAGFGDQ